MFYDLWYSVRSDVFKLCCDYLSTHEDGDVERLAQNLVAVSHDVCYILTVRVDTLQKIGYL